MLWVALELPSLPLQIVERGGVCASALVIAEGPEQRPVVACANAAARAAGIREGQALAAAKALAGELRAVARDPALESEALERLAAWAGQFTPMVTIEAQGIALEVASSLRLFGGHARLATAIKQGVHALGFHASFGLAPTPLAARVLARAAARGLPSRACLDERELAARLADLPLFLLDWPEPTLARLTDLGILRLRDVLVLPDDGLARRFGREIVAALARLTGRLPDPRAPYAPPPRFHARLELPAEAEGVDALVFPLRRLLAEFEGSMRGRGAGVQHAVLTLEHGRHARTRVDFDFASPEREADFILGLAREKLGRLRLAAPTLALTWHAEALLPYTPRESTWLPGASEQAIDRERLVQRLAARLGRDRVFGIALADDHRPEKDWKSGTQLGTDPTYQQFERGARPAWLLTRPQRLVTQEGRPSVQGALELAAGPERIETGWWDGEEVRRDYYVGVNARGEAYWIYREHRDPAGWYLHGVFA